MAQVSVGVSLPGVSIGINMPAYPQFVRVPNYPVYYAPRLRTNFFFYDGAYWVFQQDNWYTSSWYNGPWVLVAPRAVPLYVLRIPVRYYGNPPTYFRGWRPDAPPRWGEHWGNDWSQQRSGWDRWDRRAAPAPAPLPLYQQQYSGDRYPHVDQQQVLQSRNYRYQPRDAVVRQQYQQQAAPAAAAPLQAAQETAPIRAPDLGGRPADLQGRPAARSRPNQPQQTQQPPQVQQPQPRQVLVQPTQHPRQGAGEREPPAARVNDKGQGQGPGRGNGRAQGHAQDRDNENNAGQQHKK